MKHAGSAALNQLEPLLSELRLLPGLRERRRGIFYRGPKAFLHFHEDPAGLFADLRDRGGGDFERLEVTGPEARQLLIDEVRSRLGLS